MESLVKSHIRLPKYYDSVRIHVCDEPLSVDLDIARWLAIREKRLGQRPTTVFQNIVGYPNCSVLGNPYPRQVILSALGLDGKDWLEGIRKRMLGPASQVSLVREPWVSLSGLDVLPVLRHRPGDAGRYITAGVTVSRSPSTNRLNLGVYRIQVVSDRKARIFFDPRTDAYRNWQESLQNCKSLPVAIFLGADPVHILAAASRLQPDQDDFRVAALMSGGDLRLAGEPPVPVESSYVIWGKVTSQLEAEGPFGEFKGYYVDARQCPVLEVQRVCASMDPLYPTIVSGAESGLTLMALQNEYLLYCHLRNMGHSVRNVRYLLEGRGEFVALIEADAPSIELLRLAMGFDRRCKLMICGPHLEQPWDGIATYGFEAVTAPYYRKGRVEGDRVGMILNLPPTGRPVEY